MLPSSNLVALLVAVEHHVEHIGHHTHDDIAVDHVAQLAGDEVGAAHNDNIDEHDDTAGRDIVILADDEGYDVGTAGIATHDKAQADTQATEGSADDGAHEGVELHGAVGVHEEILHMEALLPHDEEYRAHSDAVDGVGAKLRPQHLEADGHQDAVEDKVEDTDGDVDAHGIIEDGREAADAATDNTRRQHEGRPSEGVGHQSDGDDHVGHDDLLTVLKYLHGYNCFLL